MNSLFFKKLNLCLVFFFFWASKTSAQKNYLSFDTSLGKGLIHGANEVLVIDKRADTNAILGRVKVGIGNREKDIYSEQPLATAIEHYYKDMSSKGTVKVAKLVIVLHTFYAYEEKPGFSSETAKIKYAADYFISDNLQDYRLLGIVDTTITVRGFDVTRKLMRSVQVSLYELYESLYLKAIVDKIYSYQELLNIENEEKKLIPAYNNPLPDNAVFRTWEDFKQLNKRPNESIVEKKNKLKIAYQYKKTKIKTAPLIYAKIFAYQGHLYFRIENHFFEMYQKDGDYFVVGKTSQFKSNTNGFILVGGVAGGFLIQTSNPNIETYEFKIAHRNGDLIPIKLITKTRR